jgi:predicted DNA-binding transcriptional regulator YafY
MARGDQLFRQWSILHLLRQGPATRRDLAQAFEVSLKTVARDIDALSLFPVVETQDGIDVIYSLMEGGQAPGVRFEADELIALRFARQVAAPALVGTPLGASLDAILSKLEQHQRGHTYRQLARLPSVYRVAPPGAHHARRFEEQTLEALINAALTQRVIRIRYFAAHQGKETSREVEPLTLYHSPHGLRLIAHCRLRDALRTFSVNHIRAVQPLDQTFDLEARRFSLSDWLTRSFDDMASDPVIDVRLHVRNPTAYWARDRIYHPTQQLEDTPDGFILSFRAGGMPAIAARVLSLGPDCRVLEPLALRDLVTARARAILQAQDPP